VIAKTVPPLAFNPTCKSKGTGVELFWKMKPRKKHDDATPDTDRVRHNDVGLLTSRFPKNNGTRIDFLASGAMLAFAQPFGQQLT
jgi:hypothetical protein